MTEVINKMNRVGSKVLRVLISLVAVAVMGIICGVFIRACKWAAGS